MRPRKPPTFYIDEDLPSLKVATDLMQHGVLAATLEDLGLVRGSGVLDVTWIPLVAKRGWVVITRDKAIRHNTDERDLMWNSGVAAFWLTSHNLTVESTCKVIVAAVHHMTRFSATYVRPFMGTISPTGVVKLIPGRESGRLAGVKRG